MRLLTSTRGPKPNVSAATDPVDRAPQGPARDFAAQAVDREFRKHQDFDDLVNAALQRTGSKTALVPSKSRKKLQEVDLSKLSRSKRELVVEQALEVLEPQPEPKT